MSEGVGSVVAKVLFLHFQNPWGYSVFNVLNGKELVYPSEHHSQDKDATFVSLVELHLMALVWCTWMMLNLIGRELVLIKTFVFFSEVSFSQLFPQRLVNHNSLVMSRAGQ